MKNIADVYDGGIGLHEARLEQEAPHKIVVWGHYIIIVPLLYVQAIVPAKLAVLHLYLNIFTDKTLRIGTYITGAIILGTWISCTVAGLLTCRPLSYFWTQKGTCFNVNAYFRWSGLPNIVTDVAILVLPLPMVYHLQTSLRMKVGIAMTFALGGVGLIASILRFYFFYVSNAQVDGTWTAASFIMWCVVECGTYQVAACFPLYRLLVKFFGRKMRLTSKNDSRDSAGDLNGSHLYSSRATDELKPGGRFHSMKRNNSSLDEEDGLGLVTVGDRRSDRSERGIHVEREFIVS